MPPASGLARLRAAMLEVAVAGDPLLARALVGFNEWRFLVPLCESAWSDGARRTSWSARRQLARRLRVLGTRPVGWAAVEELPVGAPVHLCGVARAMPGRSRSHIWVNRTTSTDNVRCLVEEGDDFFLEMDGGQAVCVIAASGHLVNAEQVRAGDVVSVFGLVDRISDARALERSAHARGALALAVRSGDGAPLLVRRQDPDRDPRDLETPERAR